MPNDIDLTFDPYEELDPRIVPPPLADPVFSAIFQSAEVSGLAMKSLLNATLEDSGDTSIHSETSNRGFRVDVEVKTVSGEAVIVEVQLSPFASTIERSLLYSEQTLAGGAARGEALPLPKKQSAA